MRGPTPLLPGTGVGGGYVITSLVGTARGGHSYEARHETNGARRLLWEVEAPEERADSLRHALDRLKELEHPTLARAEGQFSTGGRHYVVLQPVEGFALEAVLRWRSEPLPAETVRRQARSLALLGRDLVEADCEFVLADFDPARLVMDRQDELHLVGLGLSDLLLGEPPPSPRESLRRWALLVCLLANGRLGESLEALPADLAFVVARCLDPARAYGSFGHLVEALDGAALVEVVPEAHAPVVDVRPDPVIAALRPSTARAARLGLLVMSLAAVLVGGFLHLQGLASPPEGGEVYAASGNRLLRFTVLGRARREEVALPGEATHLASVAGGRRLAIALRHRREVHFLDTGTRRLVRPARVPAEVGDLLADPSGTWLFVHHVEDDLVTILRMVDRYGEVLPEPQAVGVVALPAGAAVAGGTDSAGDPLVYAEARGRRLVFDARARRVDPGPVRPAVAPRLPGWAVAAGAADAVVARAGSLEEVWASVPEAGHLVVLDSRTWKVRARVPAVSGVGPLAAVHR